jgi:hypothetical protein
MFAINGKKPFLFIPILLWDPSAYFSYPNEHAWTNQCCKTNEVERGWVVLINQRSGSALTLITFNRGWAHYWQQWLLPTRVRENCFKHRKGNLSTVGVTSVRFSLHRSKQEVHAGFKTNTRIDWNFCSQVYYNLGQKGLSIEELHVYLGNSIWN